MNFSKLSSEAVSTRHAKCNLFIAGCDVPRLGDPLRFMGNPRGSVGFAGTESCLCREDGQQSQDEDSRLVQDLHSSLIASGFQWQLYQVSDPPATPEMPKNAAAK